MKIRKAIITAAGRNQSSIPLQTLVDRDGHQKSALRIILEEVESAGIEETCLIVRPGDQDLYAAAAGDWPGKLHFIEQKEPLGYGHALWCGKPFAAGEPFLHLVSDHLYLSHSSKRCAQQLVEVAEAHECAVSAVQPTRESMLPYYGAIGGKGVPGRPLLYTVDRVLEKPTPTVAEQQLVVPGLRAGHYLCFFGMHVLTATVLELLEELIQAESPGTGPQLSSALSQLAGRETYLAYEAPGRRYNLGVKFGLLNTQLALALDGKDREEVLAQMVELLAARPLAAIRGG